MNTTSPLLLIGVGGGGCAVARGVNRAFGGEIRHVLADTDASTDLGDGPFTLLGGDRLSGRGAGGDIVAARLAAEDSIQALDPALEGVRLAVLVTTLGGGTGGGATLETVRHLARRGIPVAVFATVPFSFEGPDRQRNARGIANMIEDVASATFFLALDKLVQHEDNMEAALRRATDTLANAVTLFWRLVEKPGYLRLDTERLRHLITEAGRGRFATATAQGPDRARAVLEALTRHELLTQGSGPVRAILCGVLAGEDLRLSEIGRLSDGLRTAFGDKAKFELATVNDETAFSGRLSAVVLLFETRPSDAAAAAPGEICKPTRGRKHAKSVLGSGPSGRGRFNNVTPTTWHGEDLDMPTYLRHGINLDI